MPSKSGVIPKAYSCNTCYRKHPPPMGNKYTFLPDPEVVKRMAEKLAEQNLKEGGEPSNATATDEGQQVQIVEKYKSAAQGEVTLLATLVQSQQNS
jgi:hypothetical protein